MRATKGKRNVCIFSNLFLLVACLSFCPSFSWASALSTPSDFFLEGPLDDQAVTSSKPHYGVATFSVGIEQRFKGHEAYEGQGFSSLFVLETARGRVVARMYDPADGRFISRDPIGYEDGMSLYAGYFALGGTDPSGLWGFWEWLLQRVLAQIPIFNIVNAFLSDFPGINAADYAGCAAKCNCPNLLPAGEEVRCRQCVAFSAGGFAGNQLINALIDEITAIVTQQVIGRIGTWGAVYGGAHLISATVANFISTGRVLNGVYSASSAAVDQYCKC